MPSKEDLLLQKKKRLSMRSLNSSGLDAGELNNENKQRMTIKEVIEMSKKHEQQQKLNGSVKV